MNDRMNDEVRESVPASGNPEQDVTGEQKRYHQALHLHALGAYDSTFANSARALKAAACMAALVIVISVIYLVRMILADVAGSPINPDVSVFGWDDLLRLAPVAGLAGLATAALLQCYVGKRVRAARMLSYIISATVLLYAAFDLAHTIADSLGWLTVLDSPAGASTVHGPLAEVLLVKSMHPLQAVCYVLFGLALCGIDVPARKTWHVPEYIAPCLLIIASILLLGHLYNVSGMMRIGYSRPVPLLVAMGFLLLATVIMLARPHYRLMSIITRDAPGGDMLRRTLPQMLLLLIFLGWLIDLAMSQVFGNPHLTVPVLTLVSAFLLLGLVWRSADVVDREYGARQQSAADLAQASALLLALSDNTHDPMFVKDLQGRLIYANPAALRQFGLDWATARHRSNDQLYPDPDVARSVSEIDAEVMATRRSLISEEIFESSDSPIFYQVTKAPWLDKDGRLCGVVGVSADITGHKNAEATLRQREAELEQVVAQRTRLLRDLTNHIETVREEEKRAIARELHDDMGASLTALSMHLEGVYKIMPAEAPWPDRQARVRKLLASLVSTTRRIQTELRPNMLDLFGLNAAITEQVGEFASRTGIECSTNLPEEQIPVDHKIEIAAFRMMQEALNNVAKHAKATRVDVILDIDEDRLALTVRDNGIGIAPERLDNTETHGLRGMNERATYLGGEVRFRSDKTRPGTMVTISIPVSML